MRNTGKIVIYISDHYGGEADTIFALKSLLKDHPFIVLGLSLMINILISGLLLRMFEM